MKVDRKIIKNTQNSSIVLKLPRNKVQADYIDTNSVKGYGKIIKYCDIKPSLYDTIAACRGIGTSSSAEHTEIVE